MPTLVAVGSQTGTVTIWDMKRGEVVHKFGGSLSSSKVDGTSAHTGRIVDVLWCTIAADPLAKHRIFTAAEGSGLINEWRWNGQAGGSNAPRLTRSFTVSKKAVTRLAAPSDEPATLFAAGTDVCVVELETGHRVMRLAGHATPATSLATSTDGSIIVSGADERVLHVFDADVLVATGGREDADGSTGSASTRAPTVILAHPSRPVPRSVRITRVKKGVYHILAVSEDGSCCIWRYKRVKAEPGAQASSAPQPHSNKPLQPSCMVTLDSAQLDAALKGRKLGLQAEKPSIISASLLPPSSPGGAPQLVAVVGPLSAPTFYSTAYTAAEDPTRPLQFLALALRVPGAAETAVKVSEDNEEMEEDGKAKGGSATATGGAKAGKAAVAAGEQVVEARGGVAAARASGLTDASTSAVPGRKRKRSEGEDGEGAGAGGAGAGAPSEADVFEGVGEEDVDGEWTLGKSVQAVIAALRNPGASDLLAHTGTGGSGSGTLTAAPVAHASVTAELAASGSMVTVLSQALQAKDEAQIEMVLATNDKGVISSTVGRLPSSLVLPFLTRLVTRFQAKPSRGPQLLKWIQQLLTAHAGYLLGVPTLVPALEPLYTLIDSRLSVLKKLLKLQGRLELVLSQVHGGGAAGAKASDRTLRRAKLRLAQEQLEANAALRGRADDEEEEGEEGGDSEEEEAGDEGSEEEDDDDDEEEEEEEGDDDEEDEEDDE